MIKTLIPLSISILLISCGGNGTSSYPLSIATPTPNTKPDYSYIKPATVEVVALKPATEQLLTSALKNGIRMRSEALLYQTEGTWVTGEIAMAIPESAVAAPSVSESADATLNGVSNSKFSETNVHIAGIDEADFVKYDGKHLFVSTQPSYIWGNTQPPSSIRILETDPSTASAAEVSTIDISSPQWGAASEIYLVENENAGSTQALATVRSSWNYVTMARPAIDAAIDLMPPPSSDWVQTALYDVSDPSFPIKDWSLQIEGYLQGSRKIGNILYLVTNHNPNIYGWNNAPTADVKTAWQNETVLTDAPLTELLPKMIVNDGKEEPLFEASDCFVPETNDAYTGNLILVSIVAIDLSNKEIVSSKCLNSAVSGLYMSQNALYLGSSLWGGAQDNNNITVIHKFNLDNGAIDYRSTGGVEGTLGWQNPAFYMDEYNDNLRVVSSKWNTNWEPEHLLTVLTDAPGSNQMQTLAKLPNEAHPESIGKPNETIQGVRFDGDRGFIVTFQRTDPLYVLDLSNPYDPSVAGSLEIPGYSSYLHPVDNNYLLGVGMNASPTGRTDGVKISLFNISDISSPQETTSFTIGGAGSWSLAGTDLKALSFLRTSDDQLRFTLPISVTSQSNTWEWLHDGLYLFELNGLSTSKATLTNTGHTETATPTNGVTNSWGYSRGIMHSDTLYHVYDANLWGGFWDSPDTLNGPY